MSDEFTPQVRQLLDRLEPPALSADFADRVVAEAEATPALPPLPPLRKRRWPSPRRLSLAVAAAGLFGVAAAAAVVPVETWRQVPVIGEIVEMISPAKRDTAPSAVPVESAPAATALSEPAMPQPGPETTSDIRPVAEPTEALPPVEESAAVPPQPTETELPPSRPEPIEPAPVRELPLAERPTPGETRTASGTVLDTPTERSPERLRPADTSDTRQQVRERTTTTRQTTRERTQRRDLRTARIR